MPDEKKIRENITDMHHRTSLLAEAAGGSGDVFLQYLYGLALAHLEEKLGGGQYGTEDAPPSADDSLVKKLADGLKRGNDPTG